MHSSCAPPIHHSRMVAIRWRREKIRKLRSNCANPLDSTRIPRACTIGATTIAMPKTPIVQRICASVARTSLSLDFLKNFSILFCKYFKSTNTKLVFFLSHEAFIREDDSNRPKSNSLDDNKACINSIAFFVFFTISSLIHVKIVHDFQTNQICARASLRKHEV